VSMRFAIEDPVFKVEPLFLLGYSEDQLRRELRGYRITLDDDLAGLAGVMFTFGRPPWRVLWTRREDVPVVLHELFHLVTRICWDRNIAIRARDEHGLPGDEPAAYLFEYYARRVLKRMTRRKQAR
jgi:hypothetical protein